LLPNKGLKGLAGSSGFFSSFFFSSTLAGSGAMEVMRDVGAGLISSF